MSIPNPLKALFGGPASELISSVGEVVDRFVTTDKERLEAQRALVELERTFQAKMAETQAAVIMSETGSQSWAARNWRPIMMLVFVYIIAHTYILAPLFGLPPVTIPEQMWSLIQLGVGGYVGGRTLEKIAPAVTEIVANARSGKSPR